MQKDPKQQELRILLRPRWLYDPMKESNGSFTISARSKAGSSCDIVCLCCATRSMQATMAPSPAISFSDRSRPRQHRPTVKPMVPTVCTFFRSLIKRDHWFYGVFAQKCSKTIGFTVFSLNNVANPLVLLCFRSNMLQKHWFYCVFAQKC